MNTKEQNRKLISPFELCSFSHKINAFIPQDAPKSEFLGQSIDVIEIWYDIVDLKKK